MFCPAFSKAQEHYFHEPMVFKRISHFNVILKYVIFCRQRLSVGDSLFQEIALKRNLEPSPH